MHYSEALALLDSYLNYEKTRLNAHLPRFFNLERMERLLDAIGNPHRRLRVVHVAGTKGKGSTCAFLYGALRAAGYRVGLYTQPHLISPRERLQVAGRCISEQEFADVMARLRPALEAHRETEFGRLTFFEVYTAMVFTHFVAHEVDVAVVEVGMGGRLDATNVVTPLVSVITPVGLDHLVALGNTLDRIAREKAGIIKRGCPVVVAPQYPDADEVIRETAADRSAPLFDVRSEIKTERTGIRGDREFCRISWRGGRVEALRLRLLGAHQVLNAATAVGAIQCLRDRGWTIPNEALRQGLEASMIHGRFQVASGPDGVRFVLDAAHTADSARALRRTLEEAFPGRRVSLIVGMSSDKDARGFAHALAPVTEEVFLTHIRPVFRSADPDRLAEYWREYPVPVSVERSLSNAVAGARAPVVCITGSVYLVGEALETVVPHGLERFQQEVGL